MRKATVALVILLALPGSASADGVPSGLGAERVEAAKIKLFPLPGPIYDEAGRLVAAPRPSDVHSGRDLLRRQSVLPEAVGAAGSGSPRTAPPRRGEP